MTRDDLELDALLQAGITKSRSELTPNQIESYISRFDPSKPIFQHSVNQNNGKLTKGGAPKLTNRPMCPKCHSCEVYAWNLKHSGRERRWVCKRCHNRWWHPVAGA